MAGSVRIKAAVAAVLALALILAAGCAKDSTENMADENSMEKHFEYKQITQDEAKKMMAQNDGHIIVDVRRQDEYDSGHIPGAILIPNESIGTASPEELPDHDQIILIYCRSGNRSKDAAQKLAYMGYSRVYEFGGIIDWTGDIEKTGQEDRPVPSSVLEIEANGKSFSAVLEDNSSAKTLAEKLASGPVTVEMQDYGNFEKVGPLPWSLPQNDAQITTEPGDVILYQGDKITIYYDKNSWSFTHLAKIANVTREELLDAFGSGDVTVTLRIKPGE